jgi:ribosome-binding ATPase
MSLQIGIVGLPNVGKSTLFNALTKSRSATAENFPFCTIDPNIGIVEVPDKRLHALSDIVHPQRILPASIEFVDIAGLVKGAAEGEGLGNQFLSHIRNCDAVAMVIRFFDNTDIHHVHGIIDPKSDREIIEMELLLADLQTIQKTLEKSQKLAKSGKKEEVIRYLLCEKLKPHLEMGHPARTFILSDEEKDVMKELHLITQKPILYIANLSEEDFTVFNEEKARDEIGIQDKSTIIPICAKVEADLFDFSEEESAELMESMGMQESGLSRLIQNAFKMLDLGTYFTAGEKEVRAWTIHLPCSAPKAAGVIHTDFEKKFIKAEVCSWQHFVQHKGWNGVREAGVMKLEGKDAFIHDGEVCFFKIGG